MKEVIIHVEDCAYEKLMGMLSLCPQVEVVSEGMAIETREAIDLCVAQGGIETKEYRQDVFECIFQSQKGDVGRFFGQSLKCRTVFRTARKKSIRRI